jgi:NAD(P)-dependent dehydrogenase (short-subunit alcohol dehydrogenase family)
LIKHGYDLVGTARTISTSKELKASPDLVLIDGDITKKETAVKVAEAAIEKFGRIDLLVNRPSRCGTLCPPRTLHTTTRYFQKTSSRVAAAMKHHERNTRFAARSCGYSSLS